MAGASMAGEAADRPFTAPVLISAAAVLASTAAVSVAGIRAARRSTTRFGET